MHNEIPRTESKNFLVQTNGGRELESKQTLRNFLS